MINELKEELEKLNNHFIDNIASVKALADFDDLILHLAISHLRGLEADMTNKVGIYYVQRIQTTITILEGIEIHGSLAINYQKMYNQCVVLLMSYFSSAIKEVMSSFLSASIKYDMFESLRKIEFKLSLSELQKISSGDRSSLTDYILSNQNISFQDMNSIRRLVKDYFDFEINRDQTVNNLITALGCRHSIVHAAAVVEHPLMKQIRDCNPRSLKTVVSLGDTISFDKEELELVSTEAKVYYDKLVAGLVEVFERKQSEIPTI